MTNLFKTNVINSNKTIKDALNKLELNKFKCLVVVDQKFKLVGTITDGDIRRALIKGARFDSTLKRYCFKNPFYIKHQRNDKIKKIITNRLQDRLGLIPAVDKNKKVVKVILDRQFEDFTKKFSTKKNNSTTVVIMAGGKGTRLLPHTSVLPKPLLPINEKSMIENIIEKFYNFGFENFYITVNYKNELLNLFFKNLSKKYKIKIINEKFPLGTAGSLSLLKNKIKKDFFVINCDSLINCDYLSLFNYHKQNKFDLTLVVSKRNATLPYGLCKTNNKGHLVKLQEKPKINFLANTGFYVFNKSSLNQVPKNKDFDMNFLIEKMIKKKKKIGVYPVDENDWQDFGNWQDFNKFNN